MVNKMATIKIDENACVGCGSCVEDCPNDVYELDVKIEKSKVINEEDCMACLSCHEICPSQAMEHMDIHIAKRLYIDRRVDQVLKKII
jgi:L-aspartate semialdehyde sulfurtransferase ferredoxin